MFTTPDPARVDGHVTATRPLEVYGALMDGIRVEFEAGRAVRLDADRGAETLRSLAAKDDGASRLGELALVDGEGRIGPLETVFFDTLLDENAASHIALGSGYDLGVEDDSDKAGVNKSKIHVDFMIGSPELDVDGLTRDGDGRAAAARRRLADLAHGLTRESDPCSARSQPSRETGPAGQSPRSHRRLGVVLDVTPHLSRPLDGVEPRDEVQRHVDPGRDARRGHDLAAVDEPVVGAHLDRRVELRERRPGSPTTSSRDGRAAGLRPRRRARRCRRSSSACLPRAASVAARARRDRRARGASPARRGRRARRSPAPSPTRGRARTRMPLAHVTGSVEPATVNTSTPSSGHWVAHAREHLPRAAKSSSSASSKSATAMLAIRAILDSPTRARAVRHDCL